MNLGGPDLIVILLIVLVLFGAKELPGLARGIGQAMKEFQKAKEDLAENANPLAPPCREAPPNERSEAVRPPPGAKELTATNAGPVRSTV